MNCVKSTVAIALLVLLSSNAMGSFQLGYGSTRCSIYGSIQRDNDSLSSSIDSWALGYLSGLNHAAMTQGEADKLGRKQSGRVLAYIRAYCESNADETVEQAANEYWTRIEGNQIK